MPDMHVVAVTLPGYKFADRVLRPAKVIVAKQRLGWMRRGWVALG